MSNFEVGHTVGRWTILAEASRSKSGLKRWECRCACGNYGIVHDQNLKRVGTGHGSGSCGCVRKEKMSNQKYGTKHGKSRTKEYAMWVAAKERAKNLGLDFDIEIADIVIPDVCPLLGIKLECGSLKPTWNSPSLDKLVPAKGYTKGNIWVISRKANTLKGDALLEELQLLVANLSKKIHEVERT